jgi:hypothetical protein
MTNGLGGNAAWPGPSIQVRGDNPPTPIRPYVAKSYNPGSSNWPQRPHCLASLIKKRGRAL